MSPECLSFRCRVESYLADGLSREQRLDFRAHLRACPDCREIALEQDSTLIFGALPVSADARADEREALSILENVRAAIAVRQASAKLSPVRSARPARRYAAAGTLAACLALLAFYGSFASHPAASRSPEAVRIAPPPAVSAPEPLAPASATIYEWNPGTGADTEPKIVWIVDRSFDI